MKRYLIIGLLSILLLTACGKQSDNNVVDTTSHNYAVNTVKQIDPNASNTEDEQTIESTETTSISDNDIYEPLPDDYKYNTEDDPNAIYVVDFNTIVIDGKMIALPCSYDYLVETFGPLYEISNVGRYTTNTYVDGTEVGTQFDLYADTTTGQGTIQFTFTSTTETSINNMALTKCTLSAGNKDNDKIMSLAIPGHIKFGSTLKEIRDYYGKSTDSGSYSQNDGRDFYQIYKIENGRLILVGMDNGLHTVIIEYKEVS